MLGKCWFVLKSPFPAPALPANGIGRARGPCCPGHLVPNLRDLNFVINSSPGPTEYPPEAPLWSLRKIDFSWKNTNEKSVSVSTKTTTPSSIIGIEAAIQFRKTVSEYWKFDCLETFELQLSPAYLQDSLESPAVVQYIRDNKSPVGLWSMFMVTGIMVAYGATSESSRSREVAFKGAAQAYACLLSLRPQHPPSTVQADSIGPRSGPTAATGVGANTDLRNGSRVGEELDYRQDDPFVWAVKFSKITRGIVDGRWGPRSFTRGAQFGVGGARGSRAEILEKLADDGVENVEVFGFCKPDGAFVVWEKDENYPALDPPVPGVT